MDNIIYPFSLPIYQSFIDEEDFKVIREDTYNFISKNKKLFKDIWMCPTLTTQRIPRELNIKSLTLESQIKNHIENYSKAWGFTSSNLNLKLKEVWVNIAKNKSYQEEHNHGTNLFSGVLYIKTNNSSGDFQFINPLSTESVVMRHPRELNFIHSIKPEDSMILLFPGWLNHRALQNNSDEDRISISFNIKRI